MPKFVDIVSAPSGSKFILQGNAAFALGVVHAGYHAADGYPGTPSTEVIDKSLKYVQDRMKVGWSVSEAVAVSVAMGHSIAGFDAVVTMKLPGVFQAADVISSSSFYSAEAGAFVIFAATDYAPSSTQHVIDPRYFFSSLFIPVLEPRNHQEMYEIARTAADMSRMFRTPVVVLASGTLTHSEGLVQLKEPRTVVPKDLPGDLKAWMCMPHIARNNYNRAVTERMPAIEKWISDSLDWQTNKMDSRFQDELHLRGGVHQEETTDENDKSRDFRLREYDNENQSKLQLYSTTDSSDNWGIITSGVNDIILNEALSLSNLKPNILSLAITNPLPKNAISNFLNKFSRSKAGAWEGIGNGKVFVIEDGYRFLWEKIRAMGFDIIGKEEDSTITEWTPARILEFLSVHIEVKTSNFLKKLDVSEELNIKPVARPPAICPGCPYRAVAVTIQKLKRKKKIYASFGDIGCSTLLYYFNALDTVVCMGASDSIRQGFVLSRPEMANKVVSMIGDSTECHSGLDATRNSVFRNVPGVKIIFDNRITAMTGGQVAPSSPVNLAGENHNFNLRKAIEAEGCRTVVVDGFNLNRVETKLKHALALADEGIYTVLIVEGECINEIPNQQKQRNIEFDYEICVNCGLCNICPGIELDENKKPSFTIFCTDCGSFGQVCMQICPIEGAIGIKNDELGIKNEKKEALRNGISSKMTLARKTNSSFEVPDSIRVAIRGIGGQGNLFFGKLLSEVALRTPYKDMNILKGDTHGMAQLGGSVISVFCCGNVYSTVLAPGTVDILVAMEINEMLRHGFIELLEPNGTLIINEFKALPVNTKREEYPDLNKILNSLGCSGKDAQFFGKNDCLNGQKIIISDFYKAARELGDIRGTSANVVAVGLLSTINPCNLIPEGIWLEAISAVSPNEKARNANIAAFMKGRDII